MSSSVSIASGSSPRVRGTRHRPRGAHRPDRFIPACAGNTTQTYRDPKAQSVHPRVCGEHDLIDAYDVVKIGSSPRVRGTRVPRFAAPRRPRFIPACAGNTRARASGWIERPVHPRVCGEHIASQAVGRTMTGSSPRVRGTRCSCQPQRACSRFIPACAGNTRLQAGGRYSLAVHPRVCGEHTRRYSRDASTDGSSPRVRGTRVCRGTVRAVDRFIPACAGNTRPAQRPPRSAAVHPRVCGEHPRRQNRSSSDSGSSPRVRGTRRSILRSFRFSRFIPACAGNTTSMPAWSAALPVHPRVCGEHPRFRLSFTTSTGSSPRVRGTLRRVPVHRPELRFIPACAGNTTRPGETSTAQTVHPRVCGEHEAAPGGPLPRPGSSPRVRGTPLDRSWTQELNRFIPACAGNTARAARPRRYRTVHPRVCGEHSDGRRQGGANHGSSPRVRGTHWRVRAKGVTLRFIPACAGNTRAREHSKTKATVHPRVCGEHVRDGQTMIPHDGSSPRVRGTLFPLDCPLDDQRFIPACAGNTFDALVPALAELVHPRVCGEHVASPACTTGQRRFIPACAGNTGTPRPLPRSTAVHPRVCGEHW